MQAINGRNYAVQSRYITQSDAPELYRQEADLTAHLLVVARSLHETECQVGAMSPIDFWTVALPTTLFNLLDSVDRKAALIAAAAFIERHRDHAEFEPGANGKKEIRHEQESAND